MFNKIIFLLTLLAFTTFQLMSEDPPFLKGEIQSIDEFGHVNINIGRDQSVVLGTIFKVYSNDQTYHIPLTSETLIEKGEAVGRLRVTHVSQKFSRCEMVEPFKPFLGQLVLGRPIKQSGNQPPVFDLVEQPNHAKWGQLTTINISSHDAEDDLLILEGRSDQGILLSHNHKKIFWYPPFKPGKTSIELKLSDQIGYAFRSFFITHDFTTKPIYETQPHIIYKNENTLYENIDQLDVSRDQLIWILDRDQEKIIAMSPSFNLIHQINLEGTKPLRFSVSDKKIAVLDGRKQRILLYHRNGDPLGRLGQKGDLIHQWQNAVDVLLINDSTIAILDEIRQTVVIYDTQGQFKACVGYPGNRPPGLINGQRLERYKDGFSIIDVAQHHRIVFDYQFNFTQNIPLGSIANPLQFSQGSFPNKWPKEIDQKTLKGVCRLNENQWLAVDQSGKCLWKWKQESDAQFVDWSFESGKTKLFKGPDNTIFYLNTSRQTMHSIDIFGWHKKEALNFKIDRVDFYEPASSQLWLDSKNCRIVYDQNLFGQAGTGTGMMKNPSEIALWNNSAVVLDKENEKLLLFTDNGILNKERIFEKCLSFCIDTNNHLIILCEDGQGYQWTAPNAPPSVITLVEGEKIKSMKNGYIIINENKLTFLDTNFEATQTLLLKDTIHDAMQTNWGELWVTSSKTIKRFLVK